MAKRRIVLYNLVKNAISAYFAAIEIHNKPGISYRYETVTLLLMNAWELALKAYIKKNMHGKRSIFEKGERTISFGTALNYVDEHINGQKSKSFMAIKENLFAIVAYRNDFAHFYRENLEPCVFMLVSRCALNFVDFMKTYFDRDIIAEEGLFIMPLGFKLPFNPEEFLSKTSSTYTSSIEAKRFIDRIVSSISSLKESGVEDSIVLGFSVYLQTIKRPENSDLLMKIASKDLAGIKISSVKSARLSNDPNTQAVRLDESAFMEIYPHTYKDVVTWCKANIAAFKQGKEFNAIMNAIKRSTEFASKRYLNPRSKSSSNQTFYTETVLAEIKRQYEQSE